MIAKATEKKTAKEKREIVVPGEIIVSGDDYLAGEWTRKEGKNIVALRFGLADKSGRLVKIIPLSGTYIPRRGNVIIGKVLDITFNGWIMDIDAPYQSFLSIAECSKFVNKNDLAECYDIGDMIVAKVWSVKRKGIDLTAKGRNLGKLEGGIIIRINSNKVPRVIGKEGSMINLIKNESNCDITVGQNGVIWIRGSKVEDELFAEEAINFVTEKSFIGGLTDKTKKWLDENKKKSKPAVKKPKEVKK
jgi:exosome complex component RRP4